MFLTPCETRKLMQKRFWDDSVDEEHVCMCDFISAMLRANERRAQSVSDVDAFLCEMSIAPDTLLAAYHVWLRDSRVSPVVRTKQRESWFEWFMADLRLVDFASPEISRPRATELRRLASHRALRRWASPNALPSLPRYHDMV
jgi:hypothetical protein